MDIAEMLFMDIYMDISVVLCMIIGVVLYTDIVVVFNIYMDIGVLLWMDIGVVL